MNTTLNMVKVKFLLVLAWNLVCWVSVNSISNKTANFAFTLPMYFGKVNERAVSAMVETDVMMGMWLTEATRDVQFQVINKNSPYQARKSIFGNFIFLELQTTSVTEPVEIQVQARSMRLNQVTFCTVLVQVRDVNDFQPLFPPVPYSVSVPESTKVGSTIINVKATDSDREAENTRFYYSLPQLTSDYFAVHPTTGAVMLTAPLNANAQSVHSLAIQATDRKALLIGTAQPKTTILTVTVETVNSYAPVVTIHNLDSFDLSKMRSADEMLYAIIKVYDPDFGKHGEVSIPRITNTIEPMLLSIKPRQKKNEYNLLINALPSGLSDVINATIEVSDKGTPSLTTRKFVSIKLLNEKKLIPIFLESNKVVTASEMSPVDTQISFCRANVGTSNESFHLRYTFAKGNENKVFKINGNTSLITLAKRLNWSSAAEHKLVVCATNVKSLNSNARACTDIKVQVEDANDHDPVFAKDSYAANISELSPVGSQVISVEARDEDRGANGSVIYSLVGPVELPFQIHPFNGTIFTSRLLDADTLSSTVFKFRVRAQDQGTPFVRKMDALVVVYVFNGNDNAPVFSSNCNVSLPVYTRIRSQLLQLQPFDIDRDLVTCSLVSDGQKWFRIESNTCTISLASSLGKFKVNDQLLLKVTASDGKYVSSSTTVRFKIVGAGKIVKQCQDTGAMRQFEETANNFHLSSSGKVANSQTNLNRTTQLRNRYSPRVFPRNALLNVSVLEDISVGSVIARIRALDRDKGFNGKLWFTIVSGNDESRFWISTRTGLITLALSLDHERQSSYYLSVRVSDLGSSPRSTLVRVRIEVLDANDNAPIFERQFYSFDIPENTPVGYRFQSNIKASDADAGLNGLVRYRISSFSNFNPFFINPDTGSINVTASLDREIIPQFNLTVIATDGDSTKPKSSSVNIIIRLLDVNDNSPEFYQSRHRIKISEDLPVNTLIFWLQAHDADAGENGLVRYSLTDGMTDLNRGLQPRFRVDDRTGAIRLSSSLSARVQNRYNITARARDAGKRYSTCFIEIEILPVNKNLHAPFFEEQKVKFEISESATISTQIGSVSAIDEDVDDPERDLRYSIVDGNGLGIFRIDQNTGVIVNIKSLDRETQQYYWLTVIAEDMAPAPLSSSVFVLVEVTDVNDNVPQSELPMYIFSIDEDSPVRSFVGQVQAHDLDSDAAGRVSFRMAKNSHFGLDSDTGIIRTRKRLNRESGIVSSFDVTISDSGSPSLSSFVRIVIELTDVNNSPPVFATFFHRTITLPAKNRTLTPQPIAQVVAWDDDAGMNREVQYVMNTSRKFEINAITGIISTSYGFRESQRSYLKITALDRGANQLSSKFRLEIEWGSPPTFSTHPPVFIDENMDEMYFEHVDVCYVSEKSSSGRVIRLLEASDVDSEQIWFRIVGGNVDNMFAISDDNALFVTGYPDAETINFYNLTIQATDGYNQASTQMVVRIDDINDHRPIFTNKTFFAVIGENQPPHSHVIRLSATDDDLTEQNRNFIFRIRSSSDSSSMDKFYITPAGDIYTSIELNREVQKEHVLTVEVDDQGIPGPLQNFCRVRIIVRDENEHPPQFISSEYHARLLLQEEPDIGVNETESDVIVQVQAFDRDQGKNAKISYTIIQGHRDTFWTINSVSGEIFANQNLISKSLQTSNHKFVLIVRAQDGGSEPLSSTAQVHIDVVRDKNVSPQFIQRNVSLSIPENASPKSFVTKIFAASPHSLTYAIGSGNSDEKFSINPISGVISLDESLDREEQSLYMLSVVCTDSEGKHSNTCVTIHVTDMNDNRPVFLNSSYAGFVTTLYGFSAAIVVTTENEQPLVVSAVDLDDGDNGRMMYKITNQNEEITSRFAIDQFSGEIRFKNPENKTPMPFSNEYQFKVQAVDLGNPQLFSENFAFVSVRVTVESVLTPAFSQDHYNVSMYLPTVEGVIVSSELSATCFGNRNSAFTTYSLIDENTNPAFEVDSRNGHLLIQDPTLLHSGNTYNLVMRASDGNRFSSAGITVAVLSMPQSTSLSFTQNVYVVRVTENSSEVVRLAVVSVVGMRLEDNFRFKILNPTPQFEIGFTSGVVRTTGIPLDREKTGLYKLLVEAIDVSSAEDENMRRGRCMVHVIIDDVNDNAPRFARPSYHAAVGKSALSGTVVKQVKAIDFDQGDNALISYSLEENTNSLFDVDANTGIVTLRRNLHFRRKKRNSSVNLTIIARDSGEPPLRASVNLFVSFVDENTPVFSQQFYGDVFVWESARSFTVVTDVVKASSANDSDIFYTIENGDLENVFDIDYKEGTLISVGKFDRERKAVYRLRIRARTSHSDSYADAEVEVKIKDDNDNFPIFSKPTYTASLFENVPEKSRVTQVLASDADEGENGRVEYSILTNDGDSGYFYIDIDTGVIWSARKFDAEKQSVFDFVVRARDCGVPSRYTDVMVMVMIDDVNDNPPIFEKAVFDFEINHGSNRGDIVGKISARDLDVADKNSLRYSIQDNYSIETVNIDSKTGLVTLKNFPTSKTLPFSVRLNVTVTDGKFLSFAEILLHLVADQGERTLPAFDRATYSFSLAENQPENTEVGKVLTTGFGSLSYSILSETIFSDYFRFKVNSNTIVTTRIVDREFVRKFGTNRIEFVVMARDSKGRSAIASVKIDILDDNDNDPIFSRVSYAAVIYTAQTEIGDFVLNVTADDMDSGENGLVSYYWGQDDSNSKEYFNLDSQTGRMTVARKLESFLDESSVQFFIEARDHGRVSRSSFVALTISFSLNADFTVVFLTHSDVVSIPETIPVGSEVTTIRARVVEGSISYSLAEVYTTNGGGEDLFPFVIERYTGVISTVSPLDRENQAFYTFTVIAHARASTTRTSSSTLQVCVRLIDANDNSPQFMADIYSVSLMENSPPFTNVVVVKAIDFDLDEYGSVLYSLEGMDLKYRKRFQIDPESGLIVVAGRLDREEQSSYNLTVVATDGGTDEGDNMKRTSTCYVIIDVVDVNDNEPQFSKQLYEVSISESAPVGHTTSKFIHVNDVDSDAASLAVYVVAGDSEGLFRLNIRTYQNNGSRLRIGLQLTKQVDREVQAFYNLTLLATDGIYTSTTVVQISVEDVNDNSPICKQLVYYGSVAENSHLRTRVLRISSFDADSGERGRIVYTLTGRHSDRFDLDPHTGQLFTAALLDREDVSSYFLTATSSDNTGRTCSSQIHIAVEDANDTPPEFDASSLRANPKENQAVNSIIHRVIARDSDRGENGSFSFTLTNTNDGQFYVEPDTGIVILTKALDRELVSFYDLEITVTDHGNNQKLTSRAVLHIQVLDVNDNPPIFNESQYKISVKENVQVDHVIVHVVARSLDIGANGRLRYSFARGNEHNKFAINSDTGKVTVVSKLDYESERSYVLTVSASDRSDHPLSSECTLRVDVLDVNDNPPEFPSSHYEIVLSEDTPVGFVLHTLQAVDKDSPNSANITYSLVATDAPFEVDSNSGKISLVFPGVDFELQKTHVITAVALDSGKPPLSDRATVNITVRDVNDNRPRFMVKTPPGGLDDTLTCTVDGANCTVYVHDGEIYSVQRGLVLLNATDADGKGNSYPFVFRLLDKKSDSLFYLDGNNVLKSREPLTLDTALNFQGSSITKPKRLVHRIRVQVEDSGSPLRLTSDPDLILNVVVIKESLYPPNLTPHQIQIVLPPDSEEFTGDLVTQKLHATDRDVYDRERLRFSLASASDFESFLIEPLTGAISATNPLSVGEHQIQVRVSDGSQFSISTVSINVVELNEQALESSVSMSFLAINSLDEYLTIYHSIFVEELHGLLPEGYVQSRDFIVFSLQFESNHTELLFGVRRPPSAESDAGREFYSSKSIKSILERNRLLMEEKLGVGIRSIEGKSCYHDHCSHGTCEQVPSLRPPKSASYLPAVSTNSFSLVTSEYERIQRCVCPPGTKGDDCAPICSDANNPCPKGQTCVTDETELGHRCDSPDKPSSILSFTGKSFVRYALDAKLRNAPFHASFKLKTFQSNATVFHVYGAEHYAKLETYNGFLRLTFDNGEGSRSMRNQKRVNDGRWYEVDIAAVKPPLSGFFGFKLTLNNKYIAELNSPSERSLNVSEMVFGRQAKLTRSKRDLNKERIKRDFVAGILVTQLGFRGCIENAKVNNNPLSLNSKSGLTMMQKETVTNRCSNIDMWACKNNPCLHGGRCLPLPDGQHECVCPVSYEGDNCEDVNLCGPISCQNKGYCYTDGNSARCHCSNGFTGNRCELSLVCQAIDNCRNGGNCTTDQFGQPSCQCGQGWTGEYCEIDVDECATLAAQTKCGSTNQCFNYNGGFACKCQDVSAERSDPNCKFVPPDSSKKPETESIANSQLIIIIAASGVALILVAAILTAVICLRQRIKKKKARYRNGSCRSEDIAPVGRFGPSLQQHLLPPQVPRRPSDYQRSSRDYLEAFNLEEQEPRVPIVGLVHPQVTMTSFSASAAPSDSGSVLKSPSLRREFDRARMSNSASSSFHQLPATRTISCSSNTDQQGVFWDIIGSRPSGAVGLSPSVSSVPHQLSSTNWGRRGEIPSSPESHRSFLSSVSARRGHRSHRSDALPGHYNAGKRKRQKQLLQMIALKEKNERENLQIQRVLSHLVSQELQDEYYEEADSRNSSMRSSLSRYRSSLRRQERATGATSSLASSYAESGVNKRSPDPRINEKRNVRRVLDNASLSLGFSSDKTPDSDSNPSSGVELPPPPSEFELQALKEEDEGAIHSPILHLSSDRSKHSSVSANPRSPNENEPTATSSFPHPISYSENVPDSSSVLLSNNSIRNGPSSGHYSSKSKQNRIPPSHHPRERLPMSSPSEDEEEVPTPRRARPKRSPESSNGQLVIKSKRMKKKLYGSTKSDNVVLPEQEENLLSPFDDVTS